MTDILHKALLERVHRSRILSLLASVPYEARNCVEGDFALHIAVSCCHDVTVINALIDAYPEACKLSNYRLLLPLHIASYTCKTPLFTDQSSVQAYVTSLSVLQTLLKKYPDGCKAKNLYENTPLHLACMYSSFEAINLILKCHPSGCSIANSNGNLPLHLALQRNSDETYDIVKELILAYPEACITANNSDQLPIHCSSSSTSSDVLDLLYQAYPESINIKDKFGNLPLHHLLSGVMSQDTFEYILNRNSEAVKIPNNNGELAIHLASRHAPSLAIIQKLVELYPEGLMKQTVDGYTPLHSCLENKYSNYAYELIQLCPSSCTVKTMLGLLPIQLFIQKYSPNNLNSSIQVLEAILRNTPADLLYEHNPAISMDAVRNAEVYSNHLVIRILLNYIFNPKKENENRYLALHDLRDLNYNARFHVILTVLRLMCSLANEFRAQPVKRKSLFGRFRKSVKRVFKRLVLGSNSLSKDYIMRNPFNDTILNLVASEMDVNKKFRVQEGILKNVISFL